MIKNIKIGDRDVLMKSTAATAIRYRNVFHENLFSQLAGSAEAEKDPEKLGVAMDTIQQLAYIMNLTAEGEAKNMSFDDYLRWSDSFEADAMIEAASDIVSLYSGNKLATSTAKKTKGSRSEK